MDVLQEIFSLFPTIGSIAVICFAIGEALKCLPIATKYIPVLVCLVGGVFGAIGNIIGLPELQNAGILESIATGICSGLTASGTYSLIKNVSGAYPQNDLTKKEQKELQD